MEIRTESNPDLAPLPEDAVADSAAVADGGSTTDDDQPRSVTLR
jgi:hypothetical protein